MQKRNTTWGKMYRLLFKYYQYLWCFFFFCVCCASLLKPDSKAKLYQESDFQQNVEASKNWQNVTATLLSQQTPHAQDLVYSTPTASSRI